MSEFILPFVIGGLLAISSALVAELIHDKRKLQEKLDALEEAKEQ